MKPASSSKEKRVHWIYGVVGLFALIFVLILSATPVQAALPELRIAPLRYDQHLELGHTKTGVIDASNPTGSKIHVKFQVQAFRQINDRGELEYYDDERIASAISPAVPEFDIGPREAVRTRFTIDPNRLGPGGAYAVIFLRTTDPKSASGQINTSARVGTLLILDVGQGGARTGRISRLTSRAFAYGTPSLDASFSYTNTGSGPQALAFAPTFETPGSSGRTQHTGPFVFPGRTRDVHVTIPLGNHFGPFLVTVRDLTTGSVPATRWAFVVTGFWTWLFPLLVFLGLGLTPARWWKKLPLTPRRG